jgi:hypothetical protein
MQKPLAVVLACSFALAAVPAAEAQLELPRPSPKATVMQQVGLTEISIAYSSPGVKGRPIWGSLVPYGEVWRTGANEATTITFSTDATVAGKPVPAGTYGLFTLPGEKEWTVILNKGAKQWGAYEYKAEEDLFRFPVTPQAAPMSERMTFSFADTTFDSTVVTLAWEKLKIAFPVTVDTQGRTLAAARTAIAAAKADDWRTPLRAANYCLDANVNLEEARTWVAKSLAVQETMNGLLAKARFAALDGKKAEAIALAEKAIAVARKADPKADVSPAERYLADWRK